MSGYAYNRRDQPDAEYLAQLTAPVHLIYQPKETVTIIHTRYCATACAR